MPNSRRLLSASGVLTGALLFGATPAFAQMPVFDGVNYALQGVIKAIEQTMSDTLSNITKQLESTGPLGTILGDVKNGSISAGSSWKVAQSISDVADNRGRRGRTSRPSMVSRRRSQQSRNCILPAIARRPRRQPAFARCPRHPTPTSAPRPCSEQARLPDKPASPPPTISQPT